MTDYRSLLSALVVGRVEFILVGGVAAAAHGSARLTQDLDVVYSRKPANIRRLVESLAPLSPYLRGAPAGLPFRWDVETVRRGLNFTLTTSLGSLDALGEIAGQGSYETLIRKTIPLAVFGMTVRCLSLEALIAAKRAAGRPQDLEAVAELEAIREERARQSRS
ncbi:MAG TPA: nucleotidyl transferase AbiEii/AbiGii toxin family protein [Thermoanaerobaculia bacterium]|nr:nucleotidyl transferase AbiEii/AbiGii toxin family protein [Thermoanaerobaculia bacterium]